MILIFLFFTIFFNSLSFDGWPKISTVIIAFVLLLINFFTFFGSIEKVLGSISKKLDILVVGDAKPTKKKIEKAKELKIQIIYEKDWYKILNMWARFFKFN